MECDYDEGSGSGPGRRKTIRNLEKSRRNPQAINTLDVAFRQRFFSMNENNGKLSTTGYFFSIIAKWILKKIRFIFASGLPRNMSTRRSTKAFKAFEGRRNSIMALRRKSQMQTLGANNIYGAAGNPLGIQPRPTRSSQISVKDVFAGQDAGCVNPAYETEDSPRNSLRLQPLQKTQIGWRDLNSNM